ncbi:MAG: tripartite tricarboxylate transporter TctB family protein [Geminicoccaceae bacterium]
MDQVDLTDRTARARSADRAHVSFNVVGAALSIVAGIAILVLIPSQIEQPPRLFGVSAGGLDPALFPSLVAAAMIVVGLFYLRQSFRMRERNRFRDLDRDALLSLAITLAVSFAYAALLVPLGFVVASALTVGTLAVFYGARNLPGILLISIGVPAGVYYLFTHVLLVSLPGLPDF